MLESQRIPRRKKILAPMGEGRGPSPRQPHIRRPRIPGPAAAHRARRVRGGNRSSIRRTSGRAAVPGLVRSLAAPAASPIAPPAFARPSPGQAVAQRCLQGFIEKIPLVRVALLPLHAHRMTQTAPCWSNSALRPVARTTTASADFSASIGCRRRHPAPIVRRDTEISQGKTLILRSVTAGFTGARVRLAFGRSRPLPGYPTAPALYPMSVRQLRALPPASSPPHLAVTQLPLANGSGQSARRGLAPPRSVPCLAHRRGWPAFAGHDDGARPRFHLGRLDLCRLGGACSDRKPPCRTGLHVVLNAHLFCR